MSQETKKENALRMSNLESHQLTKECIQTALLYLMGETTFEKITVTDIIRRAGVSRAGFYRNYASKEEVLDEIADRAFAKFHTIFDVRSDIPEASGFIRILLSEVQKHSDAFRLLLHANVPREYILKTMTFFEQFITYNTPMEHYRAIALSTALKQVTLKWFENGMQETPEEMAEFFCSLFHLQDQEI